ncbi:Arc family DNA-binding protein [Acinetobacter wuhouensis]|uniref:Arc family DNA-binding protein n=1 Tax=Acinetobacter wuhouensis TaxID=1879050 RepID=UPI00102398F0|nr:Arc family DNA-binding protein [Acinetobacter wuhouensis]RZG71913.1 Arc family DNA-binding protein [Acinetobacter wuhouensis]
MSDNQKEPQYKLRWHEDLRDKVMQSAKEQNRSINAEIIARLEQSFNTSEETAHLLKDAVLLTLKAVKDDPSLLNNPKVTLSYSDATDKNTVSFSNGNKKAP